MGTRFSLLQAKSSLPHNSPLSSNAGASVLMSQPSVDASSPPSPSSSEDEDGSGDRRGGSSGDGGRMSNLLGHADRLIDVAEHDVQVARGYAAASGSAAPANKQEQFNPAFR